jgi:hypothetical protein
MLGLTLTLQAPARTLLVQQGQPPTLETHIHLDTIQERILTPLQ